MENICLYFDTQGFNHNKKFYPREIAIHSKKSTLLYSVNHQLKYEDLSAEEKKQASFVSKYHHGLPFDVKKGIELSSVDNLLKQNYEANKDESHFLVAVKSKEAADIVKSNHLPFIDLLELGCVWKIIIQLGNNVCFLHEIDNCYCSRNAVENMAKWVKERENIPVPSDDAVM